MIKLAVPILLVGVVLFYLISSAVEESAKKVVTVSELLDASANSDEYSRQRVRLGARVASRDIKIETDPVRQVSFYIKDISAAQDETILVVYEGLMPDTLREGRDVILEGDYKGNTFHANTLNTQCPSKYEPPDPTHSRDSENSSDYGKRELILNKSGMV
jgi:cytochrome c-type biogenesis protein CcmE